MSKPVKDEKKEETWGKGARLSEGQGPQAETQLLPEANLERQQFSLVGT